MSPVRLIGYLGVTAVVLILALAGVLDPMDRWLADARFPLTSRAPTGTIILVDIDAASIATMGSWPWSRTIHGTIVDRLRALEASDIAFDIDFSARSTPDGDAAFAAALQRADGSVILAALQQKAQTQSPDGGVIESHPLAAFARSAWEGSVNVRPDSDGSVRRFTPAERFGTGEIPALSTLLGPGGPMSAPSYGVDFGIEATLVDHVSAAALLAGTVDKARVAGKKVIVGATAVELRDYFHVPRFGFIPGSLLQALAADTLLQRRALTRSGPVFALLGVPLLMLLCFATAARLNLAGLLGSKLVLACLLEAGAVLIQVVTPNVVNTAPFHAELFGLAVAVVAFEIHSRRVKILASRHDADQLRLMLDRVIADNFAGIVVVDQDGIVRAISAAAAAIVPRAADVGVGARFTEVLPPSLHPMLDGAMRLGWTEQWGSEPSNDVCCQFHPDRTTTLDIVATVSKATSGPAAKRGGPSRFVICLTFLDVTVKRQAEARVAYLVHFDSLTGLLNRDAFLARLGGIAAPRAPETTTVAVLLLGLNRFKVVNDRLGHAIGDALLREVADRLRSSTGAGDVTARLGGDEFALLVERTTVEEVEALADQLVRSLGRLYELDAYQAVVDISLGVAVADGVDGMLLLKRADAARLDAKAQGGGRAKLFDATMDAAAATATMLEHDLWEALRRNEFTVVYQRQVDTGSETIVGVEALVRWQHPRLGFVSPAVFIPIAERIGAIDPLGTWVLGEACREAAAWPIPIKVSVNLSAVQLARGDLVRTVSDALTASGLRAQRLDLELTESLFMENDQAAREALGDLRRMGVGLSLDDFGTGYSSLSYLKRFAIDKIKIDQSFVRDLPDDQASIAVIKAVVSLAASMGLRVNAEGVESVEQLRLLQRLGCDEVQGYLHGRPEPGTAIVQSLLRQRDAVLDATPEPLRLTG